jgi:hypothetical protein
MPRERLRERCWSWGAVRISCSSGVWALRPEVEAVDEAELVEAELLCLDKGATGSFASLPSTGSTLGVDP